MYVCYMISMLILCRPPGWVRGSHFDGTVIDIASKSLELE